MSAKEQLFQTFPVVVSQNVVWGDMDAYEHVNNVVYFRYFENGRLEYFRRIGWFQIEDATDVGPILASTQARFRRALTYPDTIHIGTRLVELKDDRFSIEHNIVSEAQDAVVTIGDGLIVGYNHNLGAKAALPAELVAAIKALETRR